MKRTLICSALALSMATLPMISEARGDDHRGNDRGNWGQRGGNAYGGGYGRGYDRGYDHGRVDYSRSHGGYYRGHGGDVWPWLLGAAALGAVVSIGSQPTYYNTTTTTYYDAPPPPTVYYGAPSYGRVVPQQTCTYYSDGSSYCN